MAKIGKQFKGASKEKAGGKKGKLTDEERRMQEEMQRLLEEERQRKAEERRKRQLKERQAQEEKYSRVNRLKIMNQWRKLMRLVKVEDLRKEIEIISQNHEREVDRKDAIIQMLDRDLEESEEQYQMALRSHLQAVDRLLELHAQRTKKLEFEFEKDLTELTTEFADERGEIVGAHGAHKKELIEIMTLMEREYNEAEEDARQETDGQREEIKNRNAEDYNMLRDTLERLIKKIEEDFDTAHSNYMANTEARTQEFKHLTFRDQQSAKTIDTQMRRLQRLQDSINHWRTKIANNARECEERNRALREEKDAIGRHYQDLKARMAKFRDGEARRLQDLTMNARTAIKSLEEKLKRAENILKLAELNRKMETEREKVRAAPRRAAHTRRRKTLRRRPRATRRVRLGLRRARRAHIRAPPRASRPLRRASRAGAPLLPVDRGGRGARLAVRARRLKGAAGVRDRPRRQAGGGVELPEQLLQAVQQGAARRARHLARKR